MNQHLTADDFFTGLFAVLSRRGWRTLSLRSERFDRAVEAVFQQLRHLASEKDIAIRFRVRLHPVHGDSTTIRDSITNAAQRDLVSLDNPEFQDIRFKITPDEATKHLASLAGGPDLFDKLADEFVRQYA